MTLTPRWEEFAGKVPTLATPSGQGEALGASPSPETAGFQRVEWPKHLGLNNFQSFKWINFKGPSGQGTEDKTGHDHEEATILGEF